MELYEELIASGRDLNPPGDELNEDDFELEFNIAALPNDVAFIRY